MLIKIISKDSHVLEVLLPSSVAQSSSLVLNPRMYVACVYEREWFIGAIIEVSDETDDVKISFMKQDKLSFVWLQREDRCWVPKGNVICRISMLLAHGHGARSYRISSDELQRVQDQFIDVQAAVNE